MTPKWRRYLRFWRPDVRADVDDELTFHMQERVDELVATCMDPDTARQEAMRLTHQPQGVRFGRKPTATGQCARVRAQE